MALCSKAKRVYISSRPGRRSVLTPVLGRPILFFSKKSTKPSISPEKSFAFMALPRKDAVVAELDP